MTSLHILSVRLEASTVAASSTATLSTIPTDICSIDYSKFIQNYWWLRSPNTSSGDWAYFVSLSGFVGDGHNHVNYNSYGSPDRRLTDNGYFCNQYGYIAYDDYGVQYSYGTLRARSTMIMHVL